MFPPVRLVLGVFDLLRNVCSVHDVYAAFLVHVAVLYFDRDSPAVMRLETRMQCDRYAACFDRDSTGHQLKLSVTKRRQLIRDSYSNFVILALPSEYAFYYIVVALLQFVEDGHNIVLSQSFAKNFGLYGQRVGTLSFVSDFVCATTGMHTVTD